LVGGTVQVSAQIQHRVWERREIPGINQVFGTPERAARLDHPAARSPRDQPEKPQVNGPVSALEKLPGIHLRWIWLVPS
jgi:hypothetical protein